MDFEKAFEEADSARHSALADISKGYYVFSNGTWDGLKTFLMDGITFRWENRGKSIHLEILRAMQTNIVDFV